MTGKTINAGDLSGKPDAPQEAAISADIKEKLTMQYLIEVKEGTITHIVIEAESECAALSSLEEGRTVDFELAGDEIPIPVEFRVVKALGD